MASNQNMFGGIILAAAGVIAAVIGYQRLNSLASEVGDIFGSPDTLGVVLLVGGIVAIIAGVVLMVRR